MHKYKLQNKARIKQTATPSKYPQGHFHEKPCKQCSTRFKPKAPSNMYCSQECMDRGYVSRYLERTYNITIDQYESMLVEQNHCCKICGSKGFKITPNAQCLLVVDHCHKSGEVRGLLCHNCNRALGLFQDSISNLNNAVEYLESATTISEESTT